MTDPIIHVAGNTVPLTALAFGAIEAIAQPVSAAHPLPTTSALPPSTAAPLTGAASASTIIGPFVPELGRPVWILLDGVWSGTVQLRRSTDGGATHAALTAAGGSWARFTANACEAPVVETEAGASYLVDIALLSGTVRYRVSQ
jgi:hypothetical protein